MKNEMNKIKKLLEGGADFIFDNSQTVGNIYKPSLYNDEPQVYYYMSYFKDKYSKNYSDNSVASGVAFNKKRALLKLLGETLERYALSINNNKKFIYGSYSELKKIYKNVLNPLDVFPFSEKQIKVLKLDKQNLLFTKLHWVKGINLLNNEPVLIPGQLIFVPYIYQETEPLIISPISTGAAAGQTYEDALYRGICEVVERDSFMITYLNKLPCSKINLHAIKNGNLKQILDQLIRYKIEVYLIDITTDLKIASVAAVLVDRTELGPAISVGLKAGFDIVDTIIGSIEEAVMLRSWLRDKFVYLDPKYQREKIIRNIDDRAHYWFTVKMINRLNFWLESNKLKTIKSEFLHSSKDHLNKALKLLNHKNIDVIYFDLTDKKIEKYGYKIVKVIIPDLQPLYLDEKYACFRKLRLYQAPVNMKIFKRPKKENQLNKIPHPFL